MRSLAVKRAFARRVRALERDLPGALDDDVEALHRSRVASRRLREILPVLDLDTAAGGGPDAVKVRGRVRQVTRALGRVRELDVALGILDEVRAAHPELGEVVTAARSALDDTRRDRRDEMARQFDGVDARALAGELSALDEHVGHQPAASRTGELRRRLTRRVGRLEAAIAAAGTLYAFDRLHEVRIAVKQLRYALELVHEFGRIPARRLTNRLKRFQDLLGRQHDLEVVAGYVRRLATAGQTPFTADVDRVVILLERETRELHAKYLASVGLLVDVIARCRNEIDRKLAAGPPPRRTRASESAHGR
jgi:CHAD domain-containing protein